MPASPSLVWFRDDLRLADNPALRAAVDRGEPVIAVSVLDEESPGVRPSAAPPGGGCITPSPRSASACARRAPASSCAAAPHPRSSFTRPEVGAGAVFWNRRYSAPEREVDAGSRRRCEPTASR
jgi:deoxyribodipyrimidine photo-lyase